MTELSRPRRQNRKNRLSGRRLLVFAVAGAGFYWAPGFNLEKLAPYFNGVSLAIAGERNIKPLQPPRGAFATEFLVTNGHQFEKQIIVVRVQNVDDSESQRVAQFIKLFAQKARLEAEHTGADKLLFPAGFELASTAARSIAESERQLFEAKRAADDNQKAQLQDRIKQFEQEIEGLEAQRKAKLREIDLIQRELKMIENLHRKQLTNEVRLIGMQRELARFEGDEAQLVTQISRTRSQISETQLQIAAIGHATAVEAARELRTVEAEINSLILQKEEASRASGGYDAGAQGLPGYTEAVTVLPARPGAIPKFQAVRRSDPPVPPQVAAPAPRAAAVEPTVRPRGDGKRWSKYSHKRSYRWRSRSSYRYRNPAYVIARSMRKVLRLGF